MAMTAKPCGSASGTRSAIAAATACVDRPVGEIGQQPSDLLERHLAGQVAKRDRQREAVALPPKARLQLVRRRSTSAASAAALAPLADESFADLRPRAQRLAQERRMFARRAQRILPR